MKSSNTLHAQPRENGHADVERNTPAANAKVTPTCIAALIAEQKQVAAPYLACENGHLAVVKQLLAANAKLEQRVNNDDLGSRATLRCSSPARTATPTSRALLLEAGADVNKGDDHGFQAMYTALCDRRPVLDCIQLLSSTAPAASGPPSGDGPHDGGGQGASAAATTTSSPGSSRPATARRRSTTSSSSRPSARSRCCASADIHAAAEPGGPTPLSLARAAEAAGGAKEGTAAFLVLEAAKPWSRDTHKYFPAKARARAVELMVMGERLSREDCFAGVAQAISDVWMGFVIGHALDREYTDEEEK